MPRDMRSWIQELEAAGELYHIRKSVDPLTEMGALLYESRDKALLFEAVTGHPGWKVLGQAPADLRQTALSFGVPLQDLIPTVARLMAQRVRPEMVEDGPVKEVVQTGEAVDIRELPAHVAGALDAGPFIASGLAVTRDPDSGARNVSFHRLQVKGPRKTGVLFLPRHAFLNYQKYEARGEPMPIAFIVGHHPAYYMAASTSGPYGMDEFEVAGAYLGEPVRLVKCETVDLEVPCDAEIVLEGHVPPGVREDEGPYSEFPDYYVAGAGKNPVVEYTAITRRRDAIFKAIQNGSETEGCVFHRVPMAASLYQRLGSVGGRVELRNVRILPGIFGVVVQMVPRFQGEAKQVLMAALASEYHHPKIAIAVDEDVDIYSDWELLWSLTTRVDPERDIVAIPGVRGHALDLSLVELGKPSSAAWQRLGGKLIVDATRPPTCAPEQRALFERIKPPSYGEVRLQDYL
ncbi:MAG: UbiD family decarboxylase [Chloroflexi bacterium]|nr:UbiD family decarboxylase [Chloroflexota bacterium]